MTISGAVTTVEYTHFHLYCGIGAGAKGFNKGHARVGNLRAKFRCVGGVDVDPAAIRDFKRMTGVEGTVLDLFNEEQYAAFHGRPVPAGWRPATTEDIRRSAHGEFPDIVFLSAPCKGFSGLLPEKSSASDKYQALNGLTLRGVWLMLEAFKENLPKLVIFENVPRIMTRGRFLLDQIAALLRSYGYAIAETTHDCGELGGLGQSRKRFLLVARLESKVPPFLRTPQRKRLLGVGEILERLPLPGDPRGGAMHRMPSLQWKTWVRLAFVEAGSDWRSLNKLAVADGVLRDFGIVPDGGWRDDILGVLPWSETARTVTAQAGPTTGRFSVADPRFNSGGNDYRQYGVRTWSEPTGALINVKSPGQGAFAVADPRVDGHEKSVQLGVRKWDQTAACVKGDVSVGTGPYAVSDPRMEGKPRFNNVFRVVPWADTSPAVAGPGGPAGGLAVADPRPAPRDDYKQTKYRVTGYDEPAGTVISASTTGNGAFAVADPRTGFGEHSHRNKLKVVGYGEPAGTVTASDRVGSGALSVADPRPVGLNSSREHYISGGHYGVVPWTEPSRAVPAFAKNNNGNWSVADPREQPAEPLIELPKPDDRLVAVIRAMDGTWHRPFTTLELAALQSLFDPDELAAGFVLDGQSDSAWRERIGNAVPPSAAEAIAGVMGRTLLLARMGVTFDIDNEPIWVRPIAMALSVDQAGNMPIEDACWSWAL